MKKIEVEPVSTLEIEPAEQLAAPAEVSPVSQEQPTLPTVEHVLLSLAPRGSPPGKIAAAVNLAAEVNNNSTPSDD